MIGWTEVESGWLVGPGSGLPRRNSRARVIRVIGCADAGEINERVTIIRNDGLGGAGKTVRAVPPRAGERAIKTSVKTCPAYNIKGFPPASLNMPDLLLKSLFSELTAAASRETAAAVGV